MKRCGRGLVSPAAHVSASPKSLAEGKALGRMKQKASPGKINTTGKPMQASRQLLGGKLGLPGDPNLWCT